jgi:histidinol-phosphate aminotransferase
MGVSARLPSGYHSPQVDVEVRLNTNESPWGPSPRFVQRLQKVLGELELNRYPAREALRLRTAVGERHGVGPESVLCTNGSNDAIQLMLAAGGGPQRRALVFTPGYALHSLLAHRAGMEVIESPRSEDFSLTDDMVRVAAKASPDVVFLCRPNNPTGTLDPESTVSAASEVAPLVVLDEAYAEFAGIDPAAPRPGTALLRTFSKAFGLAGLRLGYAVAQPDLVAEMAERALPYHLDSMKQAAGLAALELEADLAERVDQIVAGRAALLAGLRSLGITVWGSAANFVLFRPPGPAVELWSGLLDHSVLVRDLSSLPGLDNCLRVTVGTGEENRRFLDAVSAIMGR